MAAVAPPGELPIEGKTVKALTLLSLKRTYDLFVGNHGQKIPLDEDSQRAKIACKIRDEYAVVRDWKQPEPSSRAQQNGVSSGTAAGSAGPSSSSVAGPPGKAAPNGTAKDAAAAEADGAKSLTARMIESMPVPADKAADKAREQALVVHAGGAGAGALTTAGPARKEQLPSAAMQRRLASKWPRPAWHAPWKNYRVISGHLGWVRSIAFDPGNDWFCTGSADRTIKIWDTASGQLKLTLTGHIEQVTGLAVSARHPYMFSCGLDKMVKCWDLEYNKVIRNYHGHLSGIYALALHPTLDILMTGGRDSVCRVWDMRTKVQIHCLSGHEETVASILTEPTEPQVITGSHDKTIRLWDLRSAKTASTLTYHKKSVRALAQHPREYAFASASADNIKKFSLPEGRFEHNMLQNQRTIVNTMALNEDGVLVSGGDTGSLWFWDWTSGNVFQQHASVVQPGSLESEAGIFACAFDASGTRLVTCEADKTIKMWREDENATPASHPIDFRPPKEMRRY